MAVVDLTTGKIHGCEVGSKTHYHELGHIEFNNTNIGARISYYQQFFMMISVLFISYSLISNNFWCKYFAFINAIGMIVSYVIEEAWCWGWGLKQYYRDRT